MTTAHRREACGRLTLRKYLGGYSTFSGCVGVGDILASDDVVHLVFSDVLEIIIEIGKRVMDFSDYCEKWVGSCRGNC